MWSREWNLWSREGNVWSRVGDKQKIYFSLYLGIATTVSTKAIITASLAAWLVLICVFIIAAVALRRKGEFLLVTIT